MPRRSAERFIIRKECALPVSQVRYALTESRWAWSLKGLPSASRARALFLIRRYTMTSAARCRVLWDESCKLLRQKTPGAFVECGVWRGGSSAMMALAMRHCGETRDLHLFDSFEGLPEPTEVDGKSAKDYSGGRSSGALESVNQCAAGLDEVKTLLLDRLQLDPARIHFHVGWFQDTLPKDAPNLGPIAMLRLDGDWYESTRLCLEHLYPKVVSGGVVIMDDYWAWEGCRKATDEYRETHGIKAPLIRIDSDACFWKKA